MLATAQRQPPPHLLRSFPTTASYAADIMPSPAHASSSREAVQSTTAGRGFKGLFSRPRVTSPEPSEPAPPRSRLRSFMGEATKVGTASRKLGGRVDATLSFSKDATTRTKQRTLSTEVTAGKQTLQRGNGNGNGRPTTPTQRAKRTFRLNPTALPALQKGDDGKWQPTSLSRGSMSTSALAAIAQEDQEDRSKTPTPRSNEHVATNGQPLYDLFQSSRQPARPGPFSPRMSGGDDKVKTVRPANRDDSQSRLPDQSPSRINPSRSYSSPTQASTIKAVPLLDPTKTIKASRRPSVSPPQSPQPRPSSRMRSTTASPPTSPSAIRMPPPPVPNHARHDSAPTSLLSRDHYLLRLSASFMVKSLTPIFRSPTFTQSEKNAEIKRLADERLLALARMEKAWGADWMRVAGALTSSNPIVTIAENPAIGSMEAKVRLTYVGERAKERERKAWVDAIGDGILLCFMLNHLFPAQPSHIPRVNGPEDGIARATNVTRFIAACQAVGLPFDDIFLTSDLQESSESSLGKVANTIVLLARLAGPASAAVGRSRSPGGSAPNSRPPSRTAGVASSPKTSPQPSPTKRSSRNGEAAPSPWPTRNVINRQRSHESNNELLVKLQVALDRPSVVQIDNPAAMKTPTASTFALPPITPDPPNTERRSFTHSSAQPGSPGLRPKSPDSSPTSRSTTPIGRVSSLQIRPTLRPRNTTGSKASVSFATEEESNRSVASYTQHGHSRERTPSLVSSGSRVTSSMYSRSSGAISIATFTEDTAINVVDEDDTDTAQMMRLRERRMSEKTLQNARQKILGTLLSSEDLPRDLRSATGTGQTAMSINEEEKTAAISNSLATLEGTGSSRTDLSPRARPIARRGQSMEVGRQDVSRVLEEDEGSSGKSDEGTKPLMSRRLSANGKFYVAKVFKSPASGFSSPTGVVFPISSAANSAGMTRGSSLGVIPTTTFDDRAERRQSDGFPRDRQHRQEYTVSSENSARPMQMRISSMVNLPTSSSGPPSMFRASSTSSVLRNSQALQVLEFQEVGCPTVKYQLGNCIGRGQFGSVYRSLNLGSGQMAAIKRIRLHGMREDEVCDVMREVELLQQLSHPSIVKYEGMSRDEDYLNIVLEFVENGSLGQTLKAFGHFNEKLVSSYVAKILEGLDYLHSQGVVHCDLKAANILSTKNGNVKLSDFGVSLNMKAVENIKHDAATAGRGDAVKKRVSEVAGTPNWMAPEVISLAGASFASDIWSLGCTIIELLTGKPPYADITNSMTVLFRIVEDEMPPLPANISAALEDFLKLCFIKDPTARPTAAVLFEHPWLKSLTPELALRPQDSVPFLRRVSMEIKRVDSQRVFDQGSLGLSPDRPGFEARPNRHSMASSHDREGSDETGFRKHTIVKTSFGTSVTCRVCLTSVKKAGVLCQDCGLIAHTNCASKASPRCDIQEQLALYARQQDLLLQGAALSRGPSPMTSFERGESSLTALPGKFLNGFKRSKGALSHSTPSQNDLYSSSNDVRRPTQGQGFGPRPSLETNPSSRSASFSISNQNRSSMYSQVSEYTEDQDARRRSAIRFELNDITQPVPPTPPLKEINQNVEKEQKQQIGTRVGILDTSLTETAGQKVKEGKSDCCIQ